MLLNIIIKIGQKKELIDILKFNYFLIITNKKPNIENTNFDIVKKEYNYELRYVKLSELEAILNEILNDNSKNKKVYSEILDVIKEYYEESFD